MSRYAAWLTFWLLIVIGVPSMVMLPRYLNHAPTEGYARPSHTLEIGETVDAVFLRDDENHPTRRALVHDGKVTVIWFWSCVCKCVKECEERIQALLQRYPEETIHFLAIDSNPQDTAEEIRLLREDLESPYPVHRDDRGTTARFLGAHASATVVVLDGRGRLRYRGAIDNDLYDPTVSYLDQAVDALRAGKQPPQTHVRSYGCMFPAYDGD